ncbi:Dual specificity phosphatase, catalytic domain [Popillia japonica]|uniref:Dual specificity phosphatase, catalytic domain n=1 Tax=Popillia japonica TaxID=7064 RepID=A0AAW1ICZ9_POPJA
MPRRKAKDIPDGWRNYSNIGKVVPYTRFVPFKVPLKEHVCNNHGIEFSPNNLLQYQPRIKLIIDVTNTDYGRYYDPEDFTKRGVRVEKIMCPGGPTNVPSASLVEKFFHVVDEFLNDPQANQNSLIGVHCTHRLNRTGYFICKYMISKLGIQPELAISSFQTARGHPIERKLIIENILQTSYIQN